MTPYRAREAARLITQALEDMPVVVVAGMRQSGKSTLLQREPRLKHRRYVSLDDFPTLAAVESDPESLVDTKEPVTIDEAQRAPLLLQVIKRLVDRKRRPGQFLLSGSANFALMKQVSESLAGRALYVTLYPMTRREISGGVRSMPNVLAFMTTGRWPPETGGLVTPQQVLLGGMPAVCLRQVGRPSSWFRGYEQTYLERDVRAITQLTDVVGFRDLLHLAALRTGQVLNRSELARDAKLSTSTVAGYVSLFELALLITRLPPYLRNRASRLIKSPKLYFADSGLAGYLTGLSALPHLRTEPFYGSLLETYVVQNMLSLLSVHAPDATLSFWHVQGRQEVDLVVEWGRRLLAIEIKSGTRWKPRDLDGLQTFLDRSPACQAGILAYNGGGCVRLGKRLWAVPLDLLLS